VKRILITGSVAYDLMLGFDGSFADAVKGKDLSQLSVSFFSPRFARHHGGTGANIAWHVRMLGGEPLLVSTVGEDGSPYLALLRERGVATEMIEQVKGQATAFCVIGSDSGERQIAFFHPGADAHGRWPDLSDDRDDVAWVIVSPRNPMLMLEAVAKCAALKLPVLFDIGQQSAILGADDLRRSIRAARGVIVNAFEWGMLRSKLQCDARTLWDSGDSSDSGERFLIVTRGADGVILYEKDNETVLPSCTPDKVVNPTGAGDVFRAGLLVGLSKGQSLAESAKFGAAAASFVVEQEGTLLDALDMDELEERMRRAYA
jgi:adenosine kinase